MRNLHRQGGAQEIEVRASQAPSLKASALPDQGGKEPEGLLAFGFHLILQRDFSPHIHWNENWVRQFPYPQFSCKSYYDCTSYLPPIHFKPLLFQITRLRPYWPRCHFCLQRPGAFLSTINHQYVSSFWLLRGFLLHSTCPSPYSNITSFRRPSLTALSKRATLGILCLLMLLYLSS